MMSLNPEDAPQGHDDTPGVRRYPGGVRLMLLGSGNAPYGGDEASRVQRWPMGLGDAPGVRGCPTRPGFEVPHGVG